MKVRGTTAATLVQLASVISSVSAIDLGYMCEHENFGGACTVFRASSLGLCGSYYSRLPCMVITTRDDTNGALFRLAMFLNEVVHIDTHAWLIWYTVNFTGDNAFWNDKITSIEVYGGYMCYFHR